MRALSVTFILAVVLWAFAAPVLTGCGEGAVAGSNAGRVESGRREVDAAEYMPKRRQISELYKERYFDMLFNSYIFILIFLPLVLLGWYGLNKLQKYQLAQLFLYGIYS